MLIVSVINREMYEPGAGALNELSRSTGVYLHKPT